MPKRFYKSCRLCYNRERQAERINSARVRKDEGRFAARRAENGAFFGCGEMKGMREADIRLTTSGGGAAETIAVLGCCRIDGGEKLFSFRSEEAEFYLSFGARVRIERKGEIAYTLHLAAEGDSEAEILTPYGNIWLNVRTLAHTAKESADSFEYCAVYEIIGAGEPQRHEITFTAHCFADGARKGGKS